MKRLVLGTRGSTLALTQSKHVKALLETKLPGLEVALEIVKTEGDRLQTEALEDPNKLEKGLFTKALEDALLERRIDFAVHSLKDLPTELPKGLALAAIPEREDARDAVLSDGKSITSLPLGARVGTGSPRRTLQLKLLRADLEILPIRGNVDTRIAKLRRGEFDAIILAVAGVSRLGRESEITQILPYTTLLPAPGQGALGIETRDDETRALISSALDDREVRTCIAAERAVLEGIGGGCQLPLGTYARFEERRLVLDALLFDATGSRHARVTATGDDPVRLGHDAAQRLLARMR